MKKQTTAIVEKQTTANIEKQTKKIWSQPSISIVRPIKQTYKRNGGNDHAVGNSRS
jgi:hypothetical protein